MTRIVLARHGETAWHAENRYAGRSDVALTPRGHEQAELLAGWAARAGLSAIWCSPLGRAHETAAAAGPPPASSRAWTRDSWSWTSGAARA